MRWQSLFPRIHGGAVRLGPEALGLDDRIGHQLAALRSIAEAAVIGLSPADELRSSDQLLTDFDGGVVVQDAKGTELAALPQPIASRLQEALRSTTTQTPGMRLTDAGDILAVSESTNGAITTAGLFSPQALRLPTLANTLRSSPRARVTVVDAAARNIYDSAALPAGANAAQVPGVLEALQGERGATFTTDENSLEWVVAYEPLSSVGWGLIVAEPWEDVVNPLLRTSLLTPLALIPAFVIAVAAICARTGSEPALGLKAHVLHLMGKREVLDAGLLGGLTCGPCGTGLTCKVDGDCASGHCIGGTCVQCLDAGECPLSTGECATPTCVANACVDLCGGVQCKAGETCRSGLCFAGCAAIEKGSVRSWFMAPRAWERARSSDA